MGRQGLRSKQAIQEREWAEGLGGRKLVQGLSHLSLSFSVLRQLCEGPSSPLVPSPPTFVFLTVLKVFSPESWQFYSKCTQHISGKISLNCGVRRKVYVLGIDHIFAVWHIVGAQYVINDQVKEHLVLVSRFFGSYLVSLFSVVESRGLSFGFLCSNYSSLGFLSRNIFSPSLVYLFLLFHGYFLCLYLMWQTISDLLEREDIVIFHFSHCMISFWLLPSSWLPDEGLPITCHHIRSCWSLWVVPGE